MTFIDLTGLWHFQPDPVGEGEGRGYFETGYDNSLWRGVRVPSDFDTCHPSLAAYEGGAWFCRRFSVPDEWENRRIILHFEGVFARMKCWVNGQFAGFGDLPYLPLNFDVTAYCIPGSDNAIAVWVDNTRLPGEVPGLQRGWRTFGGILREVSLQSSDHLYIDSTITNAEPDDFGGTVNVKAVIRNNHPTNKKTSLSLTLTDKNEKIWEQVALEPFVISPGTSRIIASEIKVPGAHLWSPKAPNLYSLNITLRDSVGVIDEKSIQIGFRSIEVRNESLFLNGEPIYLTGFNRHEDSIRHNMCVDLATAKMDLLDMKGAGANFVRLCHYPHHPGEIDLCDELGLLVMDEIPLYWWDGLAEGEDAYSHKLQAAKAQLKALVRRDSHHPSVIIWSVSNETEEYRDEVAAGNETLIDLAHRLDPSRLAVHVSNHWQDNPHFDQDDLICVNAYPTWWEQIMQRNETFTPEDGGNIWRKNLHILHKRYPLKPILVTEFGYISFPGIYDGAHSEKKHAEVIHNEFAGMQAPYVCGVTVWCWADHPWPPATFNFANHLGISPYGILARNRRKKRPYWVIRQLFREKQGIHDPPKKGIGQQQDPAGQGIYMIREHMKNIPQYTFPEGYAIRAMRLDDGGLWADIWKDADPASDFGDNLYHHEFSHDYHATTWRSFIVNDPDGLGVGIISAWYNLQFQGGVWGQIHWVGIRRRVQGIGLGKAMMTHAMNQLVKWHNKAYLGTQTNRLAAIKLYLDFGFIPFLDAPGAVDAWRSVANRLNHHIFDKLGLKDTE